ncbi:hypothetical protein HYD51_02540 [Mycoplasmopsis bovis]|nr:hypothetical protein HYD42_02380 [Mycoplasmopsis bovis]QUE41200.1 hypothetical protein HYE38_02585 [Mycoplasmopsis bovis]QUE44018.1 hypothetical protein HYD51_02540 [Mycoplasmopsis bovis]
MIFGVDNTMEFRLENQSEWKQITTWKIEKLSKRNLSNKNKGNRKWFSFWSNYSHCKLKLVRKKLQGWSFSPVL